MRMGVMILVAFLSSGATCGAFLISEIFGNGSGRGDDKGKEWIELANMSEENLVIDTISLEIVVAGISTFKKRLYFKKPIVFKDYLILAQKPDLGLPGCLRDEQTIIVMPGFSIDNERNQTLCVTINHEEKSCVMVDRKVKMLDGTSIFRELSDVREMPLWRSEPCHLIEKIFASPGSHARFCTSVAKEHLFQRCDNMKELTISTSKQRYFGEKSPPYDVAIDLPSTALCRLRVTNAPNDDEVFNVSLCARPSNAKKICHLLDHEKLMDTKTPQHFSFDDWQSTMGGELYLRIGTLLGPHYDKPIDFAPKTHDNKSHNLPSYITELSATDAVITMTMDFSHDDLPINILVKSCDGHVILQKSFVEPGRKILEAPKPPCSPISINASGPKGDLSKDMALLDHLEIRRGHS